MNRIQVGKKIKYTNHNMEEKEGIIHHTFKIINSMTKGCIGREYYYVIEDLFSIEHEMISTDDESIELIEELEVIPRESSMLKSLSRLKRNIVEKNIKNVYICAGDMSRFIGEVLEKIGITIKIISISKYSLDGYNFTKEDCIVFYDYTLKNLDSEFIKIMRQCNLEASYTCVLTEDIFETM